MSHDVFTRAEEFIWNNARLLERQLFAYHFKGGSRESVLTALDLETRLPSVFMVTANCSEASAYTLLGLPYEIWSGALFTLIALLCLLTLKRGAVHRR